MSKLYDLVVKDLSTSGIITHQKYLSLIPRSYKRVGHIAILNLKDGLLAFKYQIANSFLEILNGPIKSIARFERPITGITRSPTIEWLAGEKNLQTVHNEINTKFSLNPEKIMLSSGNHNERKRLIEFVKTVKTENFQVLDMFACIGNLSLPLAVHVPDIKIIGLEINPEALKYLKINIKLNNIPETSFKIISGDNRDVCPENIADLVLMGYFGIDIQQLKKAVNSLNKSKDHVWLMIHDIGNKNVESKVMICFKEILSTNQHWKIQTVNKNIVKSIGPKFEHWVFDVELNKL